ALAALDPRKSQYQLEQAYGHSAVALILEADGKYAEALGHYRVSLAVKEKLVRRAPNDADAQAELARAYNKVCAVLHQMGDLRGARESAQREVAIYRALIARDPRQTQYRQRLAVALAFLGRELHALGQRDAAFALWQEELAIDRQLAARDPKNARWQANTAGALHRLAIERGNRGDVAGALAACAEARERIAKTPALAVDRALIDITEARLRRSPELLRTTIAEMKRLHATDSSARRAVAEAALLLGELEPRSADASWREAEDMLAPLITKSNDVETLGLWLRILARRHRTGEARAVLARLRATGYATNELEPFLKE
ncbi:MAG TPA: hypothetical protein VND45_08015, partial [Thermoanaerobaculia bacterium]|nr:hypothetical protein [Thermoanaerobaculia bacterium]